MIRCPPEGDLQRLLADALPDREREGVECHVESCPACQSLLARLSDGQLGLSEGSVESLDSAFVRRLKEGVPGADTVSESSGQSGVILPVIPGYELLEELGRGGMGVVYKARHLRLGRVVALKVLLAGAHASADDRARFVREAEAVARLQHPNVVQVHEVGEYDGRPYLALEYVAGSSLARRLNGTPLAARDAAGLVEALARALHAAHQADVIHRDLKPANVLLTPDGTPKLADFGLAKRLGAEARTRTGAVVGTPSYMAPEQAAGETGKVGAVTDVYGLGAVLYECLTGRPPFRAESDWETLVQVMHDEPVPPRHLRPRVPRDLDTVCLRCLAKDSHLRYGSAAALADDLRRFLDGRPVQARPVGPIGRLARWARRNPVVAGLISLAFFLLATGTAVAWAFAARANAKAAEARTERDSAERSFLRANDMVGDYFTDVSENLLLREHGMQPLRKQLLERALGYYRAFLEERGDDPALRDRVAAAHARLGAITSEVGTKADALRSYETARDLYRQLLTESPEDEQVQAALARCLGKIGWLQYETGRRADAFDSYEEARRLQEELHAVRPDDAARQYDLAHTLYSLGKLHYEASRPKEAMAAFDRSLTLSRGLTERHRGDAKYQEGLARIHDGIASQHRENGRPELALENYERARDLQADLVVRQPGLTQFQVRLSVAHFNLGIVQSEMGRLEDAAVSWRESHRIQRQLVERNREVAVYRRYLAGTCVGLGWLCSQRKDLDESLKLFEESLRLREQLVKENPDVPQYASEESLSYKSIGVLERDRDRPDAALVAFERARQIQEGLVKGHPDVAQFGRELAQTHHDVGLVHRKGGRWEEALVSYAQARGVWDDLVKRNRDNLWYRSRRAEVWEDVGAALAELDRRGEAAEAYGSGIDEMQAVLGKVSAVANYRRTLGRLYQNLASWKRKWGRPEEAADLARKRRDLWPKDAAELVSAAADLAVCGPLVGAGKADLTAQEKALRQRYAEEAVATLRQAVELGYRDAERLRKDSALDSLRSRDDFRKLLRQVEEAAPPLAAKAKPGDR